MRDPYDVLGVGRSASEAEIKRAYEILGDKDKRGQFDRGEIDAEGKPRFQGFEGFRPGQGGPAGGFENIDPRAFADIFSGLGGAGGGTRRFRFSTGGPGGGRRFETS